MMVVKRLFFVIFAVVLFVSCSDDDSSSYHYELLPVEDALVPEEFVFGEVYDLTVKYIVPDDCYISSDILYEYDQDARNVAVISLVIDENNCDIMDLEQDLTFQVQALQANPYIFKFWQGDDENGEPIYLILEVPVINLSDQETNEFKATHTKM